MRIESMNRILVISLALALALTAGCQRPSEHVESHYAPAVGGDEVTETEPLPASPCELAGGAFRLELSVPDGYALLASPEACLLVDERAEDPRLITFSAIPLASENPADASLEQSDDGVRRWALDGDLLGEDAEASEEGRASLSGVEVDFFVVRATPPDLGVQRDVLLLRRRVGSEQLVVMIFLPPNDAAARAAMLAILESVDVIEAER